MVTARVRLRVLYFEPDEAAMDKVRIEAGFRGRVGTMVGGSLRLWVWLELWI